MHFVPFLKEMINEQINLLSLEYRNYEIQLFKEF